MKSKIFKLTHYVVALLAFWSFTSFAEIVRSINVVGNARVEKTSVINYLALKQGQHYSEDKEARSIKELYSTNLFSDIKMHFSNGSLNVTVQEVPLVTKVSTQGNNRLKSGVILKELSTHKGSFLSKASIKIDIERIKELYRKSGRYTVVIDAKIEDLGNSRAAVLFKIKEGPKTGIRYINFVGNRNYSRSELGSVIASKQSAWFRFMDTSDTYDPERFEYDKYLIKRFYNSVGYADFRVLSTLAEISKAKDYFTLTYTIDEGPKYNIGNILTVTQIDGIEVDQFNSIINIKKGSIYNRTQLENICDNINNKLADIGYAGAMTDVSESKNPEDKTIDLKFIIMQASKAYVDKININGNIKTRDEVIRRQIKFQEGTLFNRSAVTKADRNLKNLDYFEKVDLDVTPSDKSNTKVDVNVDVEEKSTAAIQFELAIDSVQGPIGRINFAERNLLGTGRYFSAGVEKSEKKISQSLGVTDPYFMDKDLLVGLSLYHSSSVKSKKSPFAQRSDIISPRVGYDISENLHHDIVYTLKNDKLTGPEAQKNSLHVHEQYGSNTTSSIANIFTYDQLDSSIVAKNGYIVSASETVAGLGGDTKYLKHEADFKYFYSFWENNYTFRISAEIGKIHGYSGKKVSISDRFNLGDYRLRGFEMSGVGPRDKRTMESLGGQNMYKITTELEFPIGFPKEFGVSGAVFCDIGALWGFDIKLPDLYTKSNAYNTVEPRVSYGFGLIWLTRFAPIRIDYATPLRRKPYDQVQHFHFRLSTSF